MKNKRIKTQAEKIAERMEYEAKMGIDVEQHLNQKAIN